MYKKCPGQSPARSRYSTMNETKGQGKTLHNKNFREEEEMAKKGLEDIRKKTKRK